jgi:hypothetical protein
MCVFSAIKDPTCLTPSKESSGHSVPTSFAEQKESASNLNGIPVPTGAHATKAVTDTEHLKMVPKRTVSSAKYLAVTTDNIKGSNLGVGCKRLEMISGVKGTPAFGEVFASK